ncbi:microcystin degradation protein MlrC [Stella humosa]|uniref:Microcystinase C n=1 Tax=Stella humosa TaxID=94 RepID=A0A3N1MBV6_9PROT|nr:M81 family metallopeptidase [Stella humosa]ROQ00240.1 microcystin degradation protein MlrC [Stella humosa]BBK30524.1 microcystinase C [Stella humosa]
MRCFTASLGTETNTFSPMLTSKQDFLDEFYAPAGQHPDRPTLFAGPLWAARKRIATKGWTVIEGTCAFAQPAGITTRAAYEDLRDEILGQLKAALPVDMVLMGLHGAMVADGYDDCEGDLLARIRDIVGPKVAIGAELDPHCHLTKQRLAATDVIICFKEFPHIDFVERGEELADVIEAVAAGRVKPVASVFDCRMINLYPTTRQPMRGLVDRIKAMEGKDGILTISIAHGFPYADVPEIGTRVVVYTDDGKPFGDALAEKIGRELWDLRDEAYPPVLSIDDALDRAVARNQGLVVITDPSDNAGGGAPGDSTFVLRRMLERRIEGGAFGPIWDPVAVRMCFNAGEGTRFQLRFGGKMGLGSGDPIDAMVTVTKLVRDATQTFGDALAPLGDAAAIEVEGIAVVLTTNRQQAFGTDLFTNLGIDLARRRVCAVKSTNHFYASYSRMAEEVLYTGAPGSLTLDFASIPYTRIQRPIWPLDQNPWNQDRPS